MLLSDLLDRPVHDDAGRSLGRIIDVRFVLDGPPGQLLAAARLHGLLVSPHTGTSFLGYERTSVTAPWPLGRLLRWRHRGTFLVQWSDVAEVAEVGVTLRAGYRPREAMLRRP